jgi:hypothetical protein
MALDVELHLPRGAPDPLRESLPLENEGVYWFLYPLFEGLRKSHGKFIDIYGEVSFRGDAISLLSGLIDKARSVTALQPAKWPQVWGVQIHPPPRQVRTVSVSRSEVDKWLAEVFRLSTRASEYNGTLLFIGD